MSKVLMEYARKLGSACSSQVVPVRELNFLSHRLTQFEIICNLSYDVASEGVMKPCVKSDNPLVD